MIINKHRMYEAVIEKAMSNGVYTVIMARIDVSDGPDMWRVSRRCKNARKYECMYFEDRDLALNEFAQWLSDLKVDMTLLA